MTTATDRVYRLNDSLRFCVFEDGGVLFDLESRACHEINSSAAQIIERLKKGSALAELIEAVNSQFDSPPAAVEKDVVDFVEDLVRRGWLYVQEKGTVGDQPGDRV